MQLLLEQINSHLMFAVFVYEASCSSFRVSPDLAPRSPLLAPSASTATSITSTILHDVSISHSDIMSYFSHVLSLAMSVYLIKQALQGMGYRTPLQRPMNNGC
jgi:hypothetical protein